MSETVASPSINPSGSTASGRGGGRECGQSSSRGRGNRHGSRATAIPRVRSTFKGRLVIAIWEKKVSAYCTRTDYLDSNFRRSLATSRILGLSGHNPASLANIFSLAAVRKLCRITMDTSVEAALCVHCSDGLIMKFIEYGLGLYYHNAAAAAVQPNSNKNVIDYSFVSTACS